MATPSKSKELAFNGRLRTNVDGASIGPNDFQVLQNLRYTDTNVRGVQGHTKINTVVLPETAIRNGFHFRKDQPAESHVIVDANYKCYDFTTAIPNTGTFNSTPIYTDPAGVTYTGRYAVAPTGMLARCTGKETLLWGGTEYGGISFIDNPSASNVYDYTDSLRNTLTDSLNVASIHTVSASATFYVGSPMPVAGVKFYVATGTGVTTGMVAKYWQGSAWVPVTTPVDNTSGLQTAGNNWFTFDPTTTISKQTQIEKTLAHWYQFSVTGTSDFNNVCKLSQATVSVPMQPIQDLFDGAGRPCAAFVMRAGGSTDRDETTRVYSSFYDSTDVNTYSNIGYPGTFSETNNTIIGFGERISGLMIYMAPLVANNEAGTISHLDYWNGSSWINLVSTLKDGTLDSAGTITLNQTGWITWTSPSEELEFSQTKLPGHQEITTSPVVPSTKITDEFSLYYYRIGFTHLAANTWVTQIQGIPAQKKITGYTFADQYAGRLMLCDNVDGARNSIRYSSYNTANVMNGEDSDTLFFGGDEAVVATAALYNRYGSTETNTFVVCKKGETWVLSGDDPEKWTKFRVSNTIGCVAPMSMVAINLSPKESSQQVSFNAAVWVSARGVEVFSGGSITPVSDDILDLFDPSKSTYLGASSISSIYSFYDSIRSEYHMIVPGSYEYVWDTKRNKWFRIVRGTELYGGFPVADTNGYRYVYGFGNAGYVFRLENGTTFDGTSIAHTLRTGDMALPDGSIMEYSQIQWFMLIAKAKTVTANNINMVYYNDTATAAYGSTTISPLRPGYRLINTVIQNQDIQTTFHGFEFSISTSDETTGFEPLYLGIRYTVFPRQLS